VPTILSHVNTGATQILAHRGSSRLAPENTLPAFELAMRQKADGIELDVQLTADGFIVVTHDADCRRLTGIPGLVGKMSLAELRKLNFAAPWPQAGIVRLAALAEVFDLLQPSGLVIDIELKNDEFSYPGLEEKVLDLVTEFGMEDRIWLSSFNHGSMAYAARLARERRLEIPCGLIYSRYIEKPWVMARNTGAKVVKPAYQLVRTRQDVLQAHEAGIRIHPWTIDDAHDLEKIMLLGVDAIYTNVPDLARQVLTRQ
jgi:glycerophosphoryl diester phosphodiesterase